MLKGMGSERNLYDQSTPVALQFKLQKIFYNSNIFINFIFYFLLFSNIAGSGEVRILKLNDPERG